MSDNIGIVVIVGIFALVGVFMLARKKRRRDATWTGFIIDKDVHEHVRTNTNDVRQSMISIGNGNRQAVTYTHSLRVRTSEGKELNWTVSDGMYAGVNIGDTLEKRSGTEVPTIIARAENTNPAATQDNQPQGPVTPPTTTPPFNG